MVWLGRVVYGMDGYHHTLAAMALHEIMCSSMLAMLCYAMLCHALLCYAMLCYATLCYAIVCYATLVKCKVEPSGCSLQVP